MLTGETLSHYRIISAIGAGGMGEVYLAQDEELERSVALKILPSDIADDAERVQRFIQEAKVVSALNHPNILTIHEIGLENGIRFIASEYVEGRTLRTIIKHDELALDEIIEISVQIATALETAHRKNIVHRDIKPENVMVRGDGLVKVLDFGLAKLLKSAGEAIDTEAATKARLVTQFGMILGTVNYMSPEQTRGTATIDARTDIWSLGVLIYEMAARRLPFVGESSSDIMAAVLKTEAPRLSDAYPECPAELERIVHKALQKNPDERYQVVRDMALDLKSLGKDLNSTPQMLRTTDASNRGSTLEQTGGGLETGSQIRETVTTSRRFPVLAFASASLVLGLLAIAGVWLFAPFSRNPEIASTLKTTEVVSWASSPGEIYTVGSFSPDSKMIAFTSTKAGTKNIWIKQTTSGEAIQITKDESRNEHPIWSPNGEELAFYSTRGNQGSFWRIPILGGAPKLVSPIDDDASRLIFWSESNRIYYESRNNVFAVDVNSGQSTQITDLASKDIKGTSFNISRDEKNIAFKTTEKEISTLWSTTVAGETPKQLLSSPTEIKNIAWHPDNKRIFYSALTDGIFQIFVTDIYGTAPRQISTSAQDSLVLDVSADGSKILYGSAKEDSDVWGVNLKDGKEFTVASDKDFELWPDVSPDGKSLAYQSINNLSQGNKLFSGDILTKRLDANEQPAALVTNAYLPKWSPDGKTIAFVRVAGNSHQIETVKAIGGGETELSKGISPVSNALLPYDRVQTADLSWSPDSSKIAFSSNKSGQSNIWLVNADGSKEERFTENVDTRLRLSCPIWSQDGKRIAFSTRTNNAEGAPTYSLQVIDTEKRLVSPVVKLDDFLRLIGWSQAGNELIFASVKTTPFEDLHREVLLLSAEVTTGKMRQISVLNDTYLFNIGLSPDKKTIAFTAHREEKDNAWLMQASGGEAKKITNNNDSRLYFSSLAWSPDSSSFYFGKQMRYSFISMLTNFR